MQSHGRKCNSQKFSKSYYLCNIKKGAEMLSKIDETLFFKGLETHDLHCLANVPKSDVHNHAGRGGKIEDLSSKIIPPQNPFNGLDEMQEWFEANVKAHCKKVVEGYLYRVEAAFKQAAKDNIQKLALSFGDGEVFTLGGIESFTKVIDAFKKKHIPNANFIPELSLLRGEITANEIAQVKELIDYGWFKSLDICGNELKAPLDPYVSLYKHAKGKGVLAKAHVGEFGTAYDVYKAVKLLELDEVHHGIAAVDSKEVMRFLRDQRTILNVCPTSNIMLKRTESYAKHPIRQLFDSEVLVTINTDDLAIFNATVSQEYLNLYKSGLFSIEELNQIRLGGLSSYSKY